MNNKTTPSSHARLFIGHRFNKAAEPLGARAIVCLFDALLDGGLALARGRTVVDVVPVRAEERLGARRARWGVSVLGCRGARSRLVYAVLNVGSRTGNMELNDKRYIFSSGGKRDYFSII